MQGMLENLSQPVAFATAPLGTSSEPSRPEEHHSSDTDYTDAEERLSSRLSRKLKLGGKSVKSQLTAGGRGSPAIETSTQEGDFDDDFSDEGAYHYPHCDLKTYPFSGDDLSESFLVIPSEATMRALKQENIALKGQVGLLQHRLEATERVLRLRKEQDHYLRDSILQASKEAQRAMGASLLGQRGPVDLGPVNLQSPSLPQPGINTPREAQYARRVKELEEELRNMRIENDRNKVMIAKFRERWDKLKESAKRKKVSKAAAVASKTGIQERILEEPEVEEEQI
ncbi:hypothetical protein E1B28_008632 [Marasmius oreades]|uniref:Uncharacterized protein n=1 Tax=Marasmius oreades TaxID=181124 RepID=A0A9P7USK7_9AGAR|nr:uncharacterized protein E1B28_008632 [Marasmius oreades]KAG7092270.1 hypothetical protein E1B28_008632 [Marasmius oreades]